nr:MAG TPA: hypothetical protein [Caudoviricetes sp.]
MNNYISKQSNIPVKRSFTAPNTKQYITAPR